MGRKKRQGQSNAQNDEAAKRARTETGESFLVKKYRPEKHYAAMDAFVKYTKSHRMLDASYVRWKVGVSTEKPFVFSTRVGGVDLGWGRGKTREASMDAACRAAFALVSAHGYNNFPLDDDCLLEPPVDAPAPPPPPLPPTGFPPMPGVMHPHGMHHPALISPPLPPGLPPPPGVAVPMGLPPLPTGAPPPLPAQDLIPQPRLPPMAPPAPSSLSGTMPAAAATPIERNAPVSLSFSTNGSSSNAAAAPSSAPAQSQQKKLKGGQILVFDPESDGQNEFSMEERRAQLPRYMKMLLIAQQASA